MNAGGGPAVRSWTVWLTNKNTDQFCVSITWNRGDGVDDAALARVMVPLIRALALPEPEAEKTAASGQPASQ